MRRRLYIVLVCSVFALLALTSCDNRREMFTERMIYGQVNIDLDWQMVKSTPNGGTVVFFPDTTSSVGHFNTNTKILVMMNDTHEEVMVPYMNYKVISFNETYDDFDFVRFRSIDSPEEFEAYTESITVNTKYTKSAVNTITSSPDALYLQTIDTVSVVSNLDYNTEYQLSLTPGRVSPLISVRIYIKGMDNMSKEGSAASISGLSEGLNMSTGLPNNTPVTHMFKIDNRVFNENSYQEGYTSGQLYVFGVPEQSDTTQRNILTIYIRLRNGEDYTPLQYDITEKLAELRSRDLSTNITLNLDIALGKSDDDPEIELPYVEDAGEPGAGFDPTVDDWGDDEKIILPI